MSDLYSFDKSTVVSRLHRWARWKMASGNAGGFPSKSAFMRFVPSDPNRFLSEIDSECVETDKAVAALTPVARIIVWAEYQSNYQKVSEKAMACGVSSNFYYSCLRAAHENVARNLNLRLHCPDTFDINVLVG